MIDFTTVSREFRSLIVRRRELQTLLGSVFAGLGIFLQNALQGNLPPSLAAIERHVFAFYAILLMVPCLILSLRMARLHGGMVIQGVLYARLMQEKDFTRPVDPERATRHNFLGVSFLQFLLADALAAFSTMILGLALRLAPAAAMALGGAVGVAWLLLYLYFHHRAAVFALRKIATDECTPFDRDEWEGHVAASLEDANLGLNNDLAFVGLMVFSVFEVLSGLGHIETHGGVDLAPELIRRHGPYAYVVVMLVTCLTGLVAYIRVRVAIGNFSLQLDPTDQPFRPLRLTDSLLGYLLMAFLFVVALHLLLSMTVPALEARQGLLLAIDGAVMLLAACAEQLTLVVMGRRVRG